jgi:hypothetical protein
MNDYKQLEKDISIRYHLRMIGVILEARFTTWCRVNWKFLVGVAVGVVGTLLLVGLFSVNDIVFPTYQPQTNTNVGVPLITNPIQVDTVDTDIIGNTTGGQSATFEFEGRAINESNSVKSFECSFDNEGFGACKSPVTYANVSSGEHTIDIRAIDNQGNPDNTPANWLWNAT